MSLTERAHALLEEWVQSESLRKHCYAVAASMRHFARRGGADEDLWGAVGLLHDLDFEQYPQMPPHMVGAPRSAGESWRMPTTAVCRPRARWKRLFAP
jgi:predicted hydrolase (HD superfamily)